jgi:hypothetical protein
MLHDYQITGFTLNEWTSPSIKKRQTKIIIPSFPKEKKEKVDLFTICCLDSLIV